MRYIKIVKKVNKKYHKKFDKFLFFGYNIKNNYVYCLLYIVLVLTMLNEKLVQIIEKRLWKNKNNKIDKWLNFVHKANNKFVHIDEMLIVVFIGWLSLMFASFYTWLDNFKDAVLNTEIEASLQHAIADLKTSYDGNKIISKWEVGCEVENSFYCGYCAYGAALISEEFFPYITPSQQVRSRWWNARDRCANASAVGFSIWSTPVEGALIVYKAWERYSSYWHVGKVIFNKPGYNWGVVRDMNYTKMYEMTDRRQNFTETDIDCYIYPKVATTTSSVPAITPAVKQPEPPVIIIEKSLPAIESGAIIKDGIAVVEEENTIETNIFSNKDLVLDFTNIDAQSEHFLTQNSIKAELYSPEGSMKVGETAKLKIAIKNKADEHGFSGILPVAINILTTNGNIKTNFSSLKFISNWMVEIEMTAIQPWESVVIINLGMQRIWSVGFVVE